MPTAFGALLERLARLVIKAAEWLVPVDRRAEWDGEWRSDYWRWLIAGRAGSSPQGRAALFAHICGAVGSAWRLASLDDDSRRRQSVALGHPALPTAVMLCALLALTIWSGGFPEWRRAVQPSAQPNTDRLVILSLGGPYLGSRRGFETFEAEAFRRESSTLESSGRYQWFRVPVLGNTERAANVGPGFFAALHVKPTLGVALPDEGSEDEFLASDTFWRTRLHANPGAVGQRFQIGPKQMRLAGVLPAGFRFLAPIQIYTATQQDPPPPASSRDARWYGWKGVVARVRPGVSLSNVEQEMTLREKHAFYVQRNYVMHATPVAQLNARAGRVYGTGLLSALLLIVVGTAVLMYRNRTAGEAWRPLLRYWGLFAWHAVLATAVWSLAVVEAMKISEQGMLGSVWFGQDLATMWLMFCGSVLLIAYLWREHRTRCRSCLHRMYDPVRIGVPGQVLLDPSGLELMCPRGHGILYNSSSILGSEMANHWLGLEETPGQR